MCAKKRGRFSKSASGSGRGLKIAIAVCSVLLALCVALLLYLSGRDSENNDPESIPSTSGTTEGTTLPEITDPSDSSPGGETTQAPETSAPEMTGDVNDITAPSQTQEPEQTTAPQKNTEPPETHAPTQPTAPPNQEKDPPKGNDEVTPPAPSEPAKVVLQLPYTIPNTTLVIQRVAPFSGIYLEDGSNAIVSNVAMVLVTNTGSQDIEYAKITMTYDDKVLVFDVSALKAGRSAAVQEAARNSCAQGDLTLCTADVAVVDRLGMAENLVSVKDNGNNTITITNLTDQEIVTVRIFYKYYLAEEKSYVGGITFTAKISNLQPNASVDINPSHYTSDSCEIVMVRTYDTDA